MRLEMGFPHHEIFRLLPAAVEGRPYKVSGTVITVEDGSRRVRIGLADQRYRRVGPELKLPVTDVDLKFEGFSEDEADRFLERFRLHYQRGGG